MGRFTGAHFQYTLIYAESFFDKVLVMSYKYGLISPEQVIESYDIDMRTAKPREHVRWWYLLRGQIQKLCDENPPELVGLFTGSFDRDRVVREFVRRGVKQIIIPWQGLGIGLRQQAVFDAEPPFDPDKVRAGGYAVSLSPDGTPTSRYLPPPTKLTDEIEWE